jgi:2-(1,2-epoxy-1,2-dihydrophenyl)acetyl-CoA isomerase
MSTVTITSSEAIATITLQRPESLNALDLPTRQALLHALVEARDDQGVRAVVITGAGRAFCSGQDLEARDELIEAGATVADTYNPLIRAITEMDKPVIGAVNGLAVGAGMGLALACDEIVMARSAFLACAFGRVGLVPDSGVTSILVQRLGHARAFELARTGRRIGGEDAFALGLINEVVDDDALGDSTAQRATQIASGPAYALALTKRLINRARTDAPNTMLDLEAVAQGAAAATTEHAEGVAAFDARRAPEYPNIQPPDPELLR